MKYMTKKRLFSLFLLLIVALLFKFFVYDELLVNCSTQTSLETETGTEIDQTQTEKTSNPIKEEEKWVEIQVIKSNEISSQPQQDKSQQPQQTEKTQLLEREYEKIERKINELNELFDTTIRGCLGPKCFDMPAKNVDRVGLLSPPGSGSEELFQIIQKATSQLSSNTYEFISESHVPAYGYGKNHGWSRIIRITRHPIPQAFYLLLRQFKASSSTSPSISTLSNLIDGQVRQLIRWHCRLSHVAAHTRMLTGNSVSNSSLSHSSLCLPPSLPSVFLDDMIKRPSLTLEEILTYSGLTLPERPTLLSLASTLQTDLLKDLSLSNYQNISILSSQLSSTFHIQQPQDILSLYERAVEAMREEIIGTKSLSMWPCRSFRSLAISIPSLPISYLNLAPNCSSHWVTCSVEMDRKENEKL